MYNFPFGGITTTLTAAGALVGGFIIGAKKIIAKLQGKAMPSLTQSIMGSRPVQSLVGAGSAGLAFIKSIPKKRGWWKDLAKSASDSIQSKWNRIRRRKRRDDEK